MEYGERSSVTERSMPPLRPRYLPILALLSASSIAGCDDDVEDQLIDRQAEIKHSLEEDPDTAAATDPLVDGIFPPSSQGKVPQSCRVSNPGDISSGPSSFNRELCCEPGQTFIPGDDSSQFFNFPDVPTCVPTFAGDDWVAAGREQDYIYTNGGVDIVLSGAGDDAVVLGSRNDLAAAGDGNDEIWAGSGDDLVFAGGNNDLVFGEDGVDGIAGGSGNDYLSGGAGVDVILARTGNDTLDGGPGDDLLIGGEGDDTIILGGGDDVVFGGPGNDTIVVRNECDLASAAVDGGDGVDTILAPFSEEELVASGFSFTSVENFEVSLAVCDAQCPDSAACQDPKPQDWLNLCQLACKQITSCYSQAYAASGGVAGGDAAIRPPTEQECLDSLGCAEGDFRLLIPPAQSIVCGNKTPGEVFGAQVACLTSGCGEISNCEVDCG